MLDELLVAAGVLLVLFYFDVSFEIIFSVIVLVAVLLVFLSYVFFPQLKQPVTGSEGLIGLKAVALESFDDMGSVLVHGEQWKAVTQDKTVKKDDIVLITEVNGLTLTVEKID
ncbi:MAG: NfeD family protein [Thermoplasmatota archaeon]